MFLKLFLLLLLPICLRAQKTYDADSLSRLLQIEKQDTVRVKLLVQLCQAYIYSNPDTVLILGQQALLLSRRAGFATGEVQSLNQLTTAFRTMGNYPKALALALEAMKKAEATDDRGGQGHCYFHIGGLIAGYFKLRKKNEKVYVSFLALLPFFISPVEQALGSIPGQYKAYTFIDIQAPKQQIWSNVTKVRTISQEEDKGWFTRALGFPRPIRAELNYEGVGAYRKAIFDKGLMFHETVLSYAPNYIQSVSCSI